MINIEYYIDDESRLKGFKLNGHAGYAEYGYDIICAAVTSNALSVINSLDVLKRVKFERLKAQEGYIECIVKESFIDESQLLLEHFKLAMDSIKSEYPKNIKILEK